MAKTQDKSKDDIRGFDVALRTLVTACGQIDRVCITSGGNNLVYLSATAPEGDAAVRVACTVKGLDEGVTMAFNLHQLSTALKGRANGTFSLNDSVLKFKSGAYTAELVGEPVEAEGGKKKKDKEATTPWTAIKPPADAQVIDLTPQLHETLVSYLPLVSVAKVHPRLPDCYLIVRLSKKRHLVVCTDTSQLCYLDRKPASDEDVVNLSLDIPMSRLASILKDLPSVACKLHVQEDKLFVTSSTFRMSVVLPIFQPGTLVAPEAFIEVVEQSASAKSKSSVVLDDTTMRAYLENSRSFLESAGSCVNFVPDGDAAKLEITSPSGNTTLKMPKARVKKAFGIDARFITAVIQKASGRGEGKQITLELINDGAAFRIASENLAYVAQVSV